MTDPSSQRFYEKATARKGKPSLGNETPFQCPNELNELKVNLSHRAHWCMINFEEVSDERNLYSPIEFRFKCYFPSLFCESFVRPVRNDPLVQLQPPRTICNVRSLSLLISFSLCD